MATILTIELTEQEEKALFDMFEMRFDDLKGEEEFEEEYKLIENIYEKVCASLGDD